MQFLELSDVWAVRGGTTAIRDLTLSVPRGARLGVFGPGGSGKTTLLKLVAGLFRPSRGRLRWEVAPLPGQIGMVFQRDALLDTLTALRNVELPLHGLAPEKAEAVARDALTRVGLDAAAAERHPAQLSGGMRKRAGIARVLAADAPIKLYDEPAAGLDPATEREILDLLGRAHAPVGLTVTASANPGALWARCDPALVLAHGEALAFGEPAEVERRPEVAALFGFERSEDG